MKNGKGFSVFHGNVSEGSRVVKLDQPLKATDEDAEGGASKSIKVRCNIQQPRKCVMVLIKVVEVINIYQLKSHGLACDFHVRNIYVRFQTKVEI